MSKCLSSLLSTLRDSIYELLEVYNDGELHTVLHHSRNVHSNVLNILKQKPNKLNDKQQVTLVVIIDLLDICTRQLKLFKNTILEELENKGLEILEYDIMCLSSF
jgi:hypothetical protein